MHCCPHALSQRCSSLLRPVGVLMPPLKLFGESRTLTPCWWLKKKKKTLCPPPCFLHTAPPLLWALAPLLCLNCFLKFTGLFLRRKRHVVIRSGWAVPRRGGKKESVTPLAARKMTRVDKCWEGRVRGVWSARREGK